eukprot:1159529-Pelagomonas_calceolata.AAC.10
MDAGGLNRYHGRGRAKKVERKQEGLEGFINGAKGMHVMQQASGRPNAKASSLHSSFSLRGPRRGQT